MPLQPKVWPVSQSDDTEGLLDALRLESATFVGPDWGVMLESLMQRR